MPSMKLSELNPALRNLVGRGGAAQVRSDDPEIDLSALAGALAQSGALRGLLPAAALAGMDAAPSCGCDPNDGGGYQQAEGYLPVAGAEDEITAAGAYTLTINIQGRPAAGSKLMMQTSAGIFSVTAIKVGTYAMQFGDFIPGFVLDPRNQIGFGVEIDVPDKVWNSSQSIVISGNVSAACTVQAELVSSNPEVFKTFSCGPKGARYATALGLRAGK